MKKTSSIKKNSKLSLFSFKNKKEDTYPNTENEILKLSVKDSEFLVNTLHNPPKPSEALLSVFE